MSLEPIAIIGIGCRFPKADNPSAFWQILQDGIDAITEVPVGRWDVDAYYDPDANKPDKTNTRWGGFLEKIENFDAAFFGIAPKEVATMDPQQRLILEIAWEAVEDALQTLEQLARTRTGVFVGIGSHDYSILLWQKPVNNAYGTTGTANSIAANRISYVLDLKGPSLAVDTACSSSLVAVHLACQSIWCGESSLALAGGVNALLLPNPMVGFTKSGLMASDGRCKSFSADANGYVRSEGAGMVVLKPLKQAQLDGDLIYAVIRGSAINQDGHSEGMAAPNRESQVNVLREAYRQAEVAPHHIQYIEAHGTGTKVGDRVELEALGIVLSENRPIGDKCAIGSVKTNIGHLETASGIAGLIKVALSLHHQQIPPSLHFLKPNPAIDFSQLPLQVQERLGLWFDRGIPRLAGVNSFGFGGTNAHVVLEEAPLEVTRKPLLPLRERPLHLLTLSAKSEAALRLPLRERPLHLLTLSAKSEAALRALAMRYQAFLSEQTVTTLANICVTTNAKRSTFNHRLVVIAENREQFGEHLTAFAQGQETTGGKTNRTLAKMTSPQITFLFTGQGSQFVGMGRELYETQPIFRQNIDYCAEILGNYLDIPLLELLYPPNPEPELSKIDETAYTQPALFALEYALARMWMSWGITPTVVLGHSLGEYVAACIAGVFSLEDGLKLVTERGKLMQALPSEGAMVSVLADEATIRTFLGNYAETITIAAINGPRSWVLSGQQTAIEKLITDLTAQGIKTTRLKVSHAFHSPLMRPLLEPFMRVASEIIYHPPKIHLISNLTGNFISQDIARPEYWGLHICQSVRFSASITTLQKQGCDVFIEIGPGPILLGMGRAVWEASSVADSPRWLPSLRAGQGDWQQLWQSLGELYLSGIPIDWSGVERGLPRRLVRLPSYPFQRQSFGWQTSISQPPANAPLSVHPLLNQGVFSDQTQEFSCQSQISSTSPIYLKDHCLGNMPVLPAAAYLEMILGAVSQMSPNHPEIRLTDVRIDQPLPLPEGVVQTIKVILKSDTTNSYNWQISSGESNICHAQGRLETNPQTFPLHRIDLAQAQVDCPQSVSPAEHYRQWFKRGLCYGLAFQGIEKLWRGEGKALGWIHLPDFLHFEAKPYQIHPTLLDSGFQVLGVLLTDAEKDQIYLPVGIDNLIFYQSSGRSLWSYVVLTATGKTVKADLRLWDETGAIIADIQGLSLRLVSQRSLAQALQPDRPSEQVANPLYQVVWQAKPKKTSPQVPPRNWLIFADKEGLAVQLVDILRQRGDCCVFVFSGVAYRKSEGVYTINPTKLADFQTLLADLAFSSAGVIHLWGTTLPTDLSPTTLQEALKLGCSSILHLIQAQDKVSDFQLLSLWLVTRGTLGARDKMVSQSPYQASLWGLGKVIRLEHPDLSCTSLALDTLPSPEEGKILDEELRGDDKEDQIAYYQGERYVPRLLPKANAQGVYNQPRQLKISRYGSLENLTLVPQTRHSPAPDEVEIQVCTAGLNFRDILNGLGMLQPYLEEMGFANAGEIPFGGECAGRIACIGADVQGFQIGDEVIAAFAIGSVASFVRVKAQFVILKPKSWSFAEAATIPTAFLTAYYGLHHLGQIKAGERILIHAAAGGVGQAAVQLALRAGAEVFATASPAKWQALQSMGVKHVFNSRTLDFASEIRQLTDGQGVDLVLNSLNGDFIPKNLDILATGGRLLEIGKIGIWDESRVRQKRADVSYHVFDLLTIAKHQPNLIATLLAELMQSFERGSLKPLPHKVFSLEESIGAFRYMASAKHVGKVVISLAEHPLTSGPIQEKGAYLITGGWGDLGLQVAGWLTQQGAKFLILIGRSQPSSAQKAIISQLERTGVQIKLIKADLANAEAVNRVLGNYRPTARNTGRKRSKTEPPLKGVIHTAGLLDDGVLLNQTWERFEAVMAPKIAGTWNLHSATQDCPLDFFICFSSIVSLLGSPGQGAYVAANACMDALMHYRRSLGLTGLSINWGPWAQTGMVEHLNNRAKGIALIEPERGLALLGQLMTQDETQVGVLEVDWSQFLTQLPHSSPFLSSLKFPPAATVSSSPPLPKSSSESHPILAQLEGLEGKNHLLKYLQTQLARVLGFSSTDTIEIEQDFSDFGLDSLMAVEFRNILQADLGMAISSNVAFDYPTIAFLADYLLGEILGQDKAEIPQKQVSGDNNGSSNLFLAETVDIPPQFYHFELFSEYLSLERDMENARHLRNPFFTIHEGVSSNIITVAGRELINYSSYNYLGLSGTVQVSQAAQEAIKQYGTSVSASRVLSGEIPLHLELEREIADFLGTEDCIVYIGGHATNVSTIGHLLQKNDLILYDALSHNSIRQGCLLSGATALEFPHNDWQVLEQLLQQHRRHYEKVLIVIEGIYSSDGDIAPLPEIVALKKQYKTFLMVDEAHSLGVLGASGRGIAEYFGISPADVDLWMGTLSKSLASCGGYIAASSAIVKYLKYTAPGFVFSVGMSPANTAAALVALRLLKSEPERVTRLQERAKFFLSLAQSLGFNTGLSANSPIVPIIVGESQHAVNLSNSLFQQGINVQPMIYPSVPYNAARLRFFMTCDHTEAQIHQTLTKLKEVDKVKNARSG